MEQSRQSPDWLDLDSKAPEAPASETEFAQVYYDLFVSNPLGAKLLAHWDEAILRKPVVVNAPLQEYVHAEAQRAFVRGIKGQILLAQQARGAR